MPWRTSLLAHWRKFASEHFEVATVRVMYFATTIDSFVVCASLAPTTLSLPVSGFYALLLSATAYYHPVLWHWPSGAGYYSSILIAAVCVRWLRPKTFVPARHQPRNEKPLSQRVIVFNLDGFSLHAFRRARMPFLKKMAEEHAVASEGAITVYRALTNPAFASIIT